MTAATSKRHKWRHESKETSVCTVCGTRAHRRPDPNSRRWFTEWQLPDGTFVNNYAGGKTPPCPGAPA